MRHSWHLLLIGTGLCWAGGAAAQTATQQSDPATNAHDQPAADSGLGDIVVTARRVSESLQTVPVAVTALSAESLVRAQLTNLAQIQNNAPGLTFSIVPAQPGSASIFMRGQGSADGLIAVDNSIGTYINGVYAARSTGGAFDLIDVQRVEVLRGPQGTLFGRNTNGGAVNIIPNEPSSRLEGSARFDYGNYDAFLARGVLNLPLVGDQLAVRFAYQHRQHGSYAYNVTLNRGEGSENVDSGRASLRFAPTDLPFKVLVQGDYTDAHTNGLIRGLKGFTPTGSNQAVINACSNGTAVASNLSCPFSRPGGDSFANYAYGQNGNDDIFRVYNDRAGYGSSKSWGVASTVDVPLTDAVALKSISAWRGTRLRSVSDSDGTPYVLVGVVGNDYVGVTQDQFSQELQLTGKAMGSRLDFILGGFYFVENGNDYSPGGSLVPVNPSYLIVDATARNKSTAGYGQLTFAVTKAIRITAGARYTDDNRKLVLRNRNLNLVTGALTAAYLPTDGDPADPFRATAERSFQYWSYTISADWQITPGAFVYIKHSRGYRSGGFNERAVTGGVPPISFDPERDMDYEVGAKLDLLDRRMRLNLAAFRSDLTGLQRNQSGLSGGRTVAGIANGASARIYGGEAELTVRPTRGVTLGGSVGLVYPKYLSFFSIIDRADYTDTPFQFAPKATYTANADYELPVQGAGTLGFHLDFSLRTKAYYAPLKIATNTAAQNAVLQETAAIPGYGLLNGRISFKLDDPDIELAVFARNMTNRAYFTHLLTYQNNALGFSSYTPGDPRTFGVSVSYQF